MIKVRYSVGKERREAWFWNRVVMGEFLKRTIYSKLEIEGGNLHEEECSETLLLQIRRPLEKDY